MNSDLRELLESCETYINGCKSFKLRSSVPYDIQVQVWLTFLNKVSAMRAKYRSPEAQTEELWEAFVKLEKRVNEVCDKLNEIHDRATPEP